VAWDWSTGRCDLALRFLVCRTGVGGRGKIVSFGHITIRCGLCLYLVMGVGVGLPHPPFPLQVTYWVSMKCTNFLGFPTWHISLRFCVQVHIQVRTSDLRLILEYPVIPFVNYFYLCTTLVYGPGSSVGKATDYGLDGPGSNPGGDEIFRPSRPALRPIQSPVQWVPGLSRG